MTEQPDTAAIRAFYADEPHDDPLYADMLVVLRALDVARVERRYTDPTPGHVVGVINALTARAEAAEARIAAALDLTQHGPLASTQAVMLAAIRSALIGE